MGAPERTGTAETPALQVATARARFSGSQEPAAAAVVAVPDRDEQIRELLRVISRPQSNESGQEDQREAAERLHTLGTADALHQLSAETHDTAFARALLRDTRWDVAGAGHVPIAGQRDPIRVVVHLVRLRLARAAGLVAGRWASASLCVAAAGALGGAAGGIVLTLAPGSTSPPPAIAVLSVLGAGIGAVAGAGVGAGLAMSEAVVRSRRVTGLMVCGALGGGAAGLALQILTQWTLKLLLGLDLSLGGAIEGLIIGAAAGLGYGAATDKTTGGLAAPTGSARTRVALITAAACALAAVGISLSGRPLVGGTINVIAQASKGAQVALAPLGALIGEPGFGRVTASLIATGEGAFFGAGLAFGLTHRRRVR